MASDQWRVLLLATNHWPLIADLRRLGEEVFDFIYFFVVQVEIAASHDASGLLGVAGSNDGTGDGGVAQGPGDGDFADRAVVTLGDFAKTLD